MGKEHKDHKDHKDHKEHDCARIKVHKVHWGILRGETGDTGRRGKKGERGHHGKSGRHGRHGRDGNDAVLSFGMAVNDVSGEIAFTANTAISFNNTFFPYLDVNITGTNVQLEDEGVYQFNYMVRGVSANVLNPTHIGLKYNGNLLAGSTFGLLSDQFETLNGSVIAEISAPMGNVQLFNLAVDDIVYDNTDNTNNATINVIRLV
jgi:hypothetical protein